MTTIPLPSIKLSAPIPSTDKKRRVLLVDNSANKRELRAEIMRKLGIEVDLAADVGEARSWWKVDLYDLVLINVENTRGNRDKFCDDIRAAAPRQRFAFLVGKPEYLSGSPSPDSPLLLSQDGDNIPMANVKAAMAADIGDLPQRWGILEASRRISAVRSASNARTQAIRNRPAPRRDLETRYADYAASSRTLDDLLGKDMQ
jgi:CheY-like chemotaxis protein